MYIKPFLFLSVTFLCLYMYLSFTFYTTFLSFLITLTLFMHIGCFLSKGLIPGSSDMFTTHNRQYPESTVVKTHRLFEWAHFLQKSIVDFQVNRFYFLQSMMTTMMLILRKALICCVGRADIHHLVLRVC